MGILTLNGPEPKQCDHVDEKQPHHKGRVRGRYKFLIYFLLNQKQHWSHPYKWKTAPPKKLIFRIKETNQSNSVSKLQPNPKSTIPRE